MQIVRMPYTNHLRHTQQFLDHFLHFIVHPFEVAVQHDFLLAVILELVDFRQRHIVVLFVLNFLHIEVRLAEVLRSLELFHCSMSKWFSIRSSVAVKSRAA